MKVFLDANICLDLLDTTRETSSQSVKWYMDNKDNEDMEFYFSSDFITTFFYILTQKKKELPQVAIDVIDILSTEVTPFYLNHDDFINAKFDFQNAILNDFEDLFVLNSATRLKCELFLTNDKELLELNQFKGMNIEIPSVKITPINIDDIVV